MCGTFIKERVHSEIFKFLEQSSLFKFVATRKIKFLCFLLMIIRILRSSDSQSMRDDDTFLKSDWSEELVLSLTSQFLIIRILLSVSVVLSHLQVYISYIFLCVFICAHPIRCCRIILCVRVCVSAETYLPGC